MWAYLPGMPQSLHVSEVKGCDDHWTQENPKPISNRYSGGRLDIFP